MTTHPPDREGASQSPEPATSTSPPGREGPGSSAGPQSPGAPPPGPQSPAPQSSAAAPAPGPQSPSGPTPQSPPGPQSPVAPPQSPPGPQSPGAPTIPGYSGPVPPGGWQQQPVSQASGALADWGPRLGATLLDALLWFVASFLIGIVVGFVFGAGSAATGAEGLATAGAILNALIGFALYAAYTGFLMIRPGQRNGQTLGKQLLGIRVVRADGAPVTLGTVAIRHWLMKYLVFGFVAVITLYIATLLNYLWPLWDKENRAFHDMAASTRVVRA